MGPVLVTRWLRGTCLVWLGAMCGPVFAAFAGVEPADVDGTGLSRSFLLIVIAVLIVLLIRAESRASSSGAAASQREREALQELARQQRIAAELAARADDAERRLTTLSAYDAAFIDGELSELEWFEKAAPLVAPHAIPGGGREPGSRQPSSKNI